MALQADAGNVNALGLKFFDQRDRAVTFRRVFQRVIVVIQFACGSASCAN